MLQDVLQVFIWTLALGVAIVIPMTVRKSRSLCGGWLALYLAAYCFLSGNGEYSRDMADGSQRWMPMYCGKVALAAGREVPELNGMGAFFAPLLWADRAVLHPKKYPKGRLLRSPRTS